MGHVHAPSGYNRLFAVGIGLNLSFVAAEGLAGWYGNSLSLLADAGHNLSDVLSLALAWGASILSERAATQRRTYGLRRSSILAALINAILLLIAIGAIAWESIHRFSAPIVPDSTIVILVAAIGVVINTATALLFMRGRKHDLNLRGAFLHMAADAAVSVGVVIAGIVIAYTQWYWVDPMVSLMIVAVIAVGSWQLLRESLDLVLDAVPESVDPQAVETYLNELPEVQSVHHLHIWAMSTTEVALTAHLVKPDGRLDDAFMRKVHRELHKRFGIGHATLQLEAGDEIRDCSSAYNQAHSH